MVGDLTESPKVAELKPVRRRTGPQVSKNSVESGPRVCLVNCFPPSRLFG